MTIIVPEELRVALEREAASRKLSSLSALMREIVAARYPDVAYSKTPDHSRRNGQKVKKRQEKTKGDADKRVHDLLEQCAERRTIEQLLASLGWTRRDLDELLTELVADSRLATGMSFGESWFQAVATTTSDEEAVERVRAQLAVAATFFPMSMDSIVVATGLDYPVVARACESLEADGVAELVEAGVRLVT